MSFTVSFYWKSNILARVQEESTAAAPVVDVYHIFEVGLQQAASL
jgi:hypothetical protein